MLVGLYHPSAGRAVLGGLEVSRHTEHLQKRLGLCPQFDVLYDDLTVEEHLLFYARLKGYPRHQELQHVTALIDEVAFPLLSCFMPC